MPVYRNVEHLKLARLKVFDSESQSRRWPRSGELKGSSESLLNRECHRLINRQLRGCTWALFIGPSG